MKRDAFRDMHANKHPDARVLLDARCSSPAPHVCPPLRQPRLEEAMHRDCSVYPFVTNVEAFILRSTALQTGRHNDNIVSNPDFRVPIRQFSDRVGGVAVLVAATFPGIPRVSLRAAIAIAADRIRIDFISTPATVIPKPSGDYGALFVPHRLSGAWRQRIFQPESFWVRPILFLHEPS